VAGLTEILAGDVEAPQAAPVEDNLEQLIQMYNAAEEASHEARDNSERDRDYVDNKQLTQAEIDTLRKRGQPPIVLNVIRSRSSFLAGMEKKQRRDPKAWPRNNPDDVNAAEAFTQGMRYVVDKADYASSRSQAWKNVTVEGFGAIELAAVQNRKGDYDITMKRIPWDRLFYDPHSSEPSFSDARYVGQVLWMDYDEALSRAVNAGKAKEDVEAILDTTIESAPGIGKTYDDKPKWTVWADRIRKRVRVVMIWHREVDGWKYCEFTKGGKLIESDGPYVDQDGETYCPWVLESANVDRDNNRYGEMRHLIDPQDEINKRRSKALHLLNTNGVIASQGAVDDINKTRGELARPDFYIEVQTGAEFRIERSLELAAGQSQLGEQAMRYIAEAGPNQALLGKGTQDQSGRAIEAQQAGGLVEQSDLMDTLRRMDLRVFTIIASMMKQFWTAQKWVRTTDNPEVPEYIGLNEPMWTDPMTGETAPEGEWRKLQQQGAQLPELVPAVDPQTGQPMVNNNVAELDMDIIVSDAPDSITLDGETFEAVMQLLGSGVDPRFMKFAIELHPGIPAKRKKQLIDILEEITKPAEPNEQQSEQERLAKEMAEAKIAETRANTYQKLADGESKMVKAYTEPLPMPDVAEGMTDAQQGPPDGMQMPPMGEQPEPVPMGPDGPPQMAPGPGEIPGPAPQMAPEPMPGPPLVGMMTGQ